jgi:hypothetical protein
MPVLADPGFAYAQKNPMDTYREAADTTLSIMERKQAARQREQALAMNQQAQDLQREKWEVERPLKLQEAKTLTMQYGASLANQQQILKLREEFALAAPQLQTDLEAAGEIPVDAAGDPDFDAAWQNFSRVSAKYQKFAVLPEAKAPLDFADKQTIQHAARAGVLATEKFKADARRQTMGRGFQKDLIKQPDGSFKPMLITRDDAGNITAMADLPKSQESSEDATLGAERAKQAVGYLANVRDAGERAATDLSSIDQMTAMFQTGAQSGTGQTAINTIRSLAVRFGLGSAEQLATDQGLQSATQGFALNVAKGMKGQGQITENERAMIERATVNVGFNPEANLRIMAVLKRAANRAAQLNAMRIDLEGKGANEIQISRQLQKFVSDNPIGAEALENLIGERMARPASGGVRMVPMLFPDGKGGFIKGDIPEDRVKDAETKGFTRG